MTAEHQAQVGLVSGTVSAAVFNAALGADPASISTWFMNVGQGLLTKISSGYAINRDRSLSYLTRHAALNNASVMPVPGSLDMAALHARLQITGPVAFKTAIDGGKTEAEALHSMATQMSGVAEEAARNGDRDVITRTATRGRGVVGWRRHTTGLGCGFCSMLVSRGSVYITRATATLSFKSEPFHPHCHCYAEPLYQRQAEPPEVLLLQRQWKHVTAGANSPAEAQRMWRQHWEQRATPEARARMGIPEPGTLRGLEEHVPAVPAVPAAAPTGPFATTWDALPRVENPDDLLAQAMGTNPRYGQAYLGELPPGTIGPVSYSQNCTRVAITYEMRRRGFDVTAGAGSAIGDTTAAYVRTFRLDGAYATRVAEDLSRNMTAREIAAEVETWPLGARGIVTVQGHTLNVERDIATGRAVFIDAQAAVKKNPVMNVTGFQRRMASRGAPADRMAVARVDDLEVSDYGLHYVESPELPLSGGILGKTQFPTLPGTEAQARSFAELAKLKPDDTYGAASLRGPPRTVAELRAAVQEHGITVPAGLNKPALERLVADLESGVAPATARQTAVEAAGRAPAKAAPAKAAKKVTGTKAVPPGNADAFAARQAKIRQIAERADLTETPFAVGTQGQTRLATAPNGDKIVRKTFRGRISGTMSGPQIADAEQLAARVFDALGVRVPTMVRVADDTIAMDFIEGRLGADLISNPDQIPARFLHSDDGRHIGLGDLLTKNMDRSPRNWIQTEDGHLAAVDFGFAFEPGRDAFRGVSEFAQQFVSYGRPVANDFTRAEMAEIRARLAALRPEFEAMGHADWHAEMMQTLTRVSRQAKGAEAKAAVRAPAKVAAPKPPPVPARMTIPALRSELQPIIDAAPDISRFDLAGVPKDTLQQWVARARSLPETERPLEVARWQQVIADKRRKLVDTLVEADELVANGASTRAFAARAAARLRSAEAELAGWPELAEIRKVSTAMQTGDPVKIRRAIKASGKKLGLQQIGADAGQASRFERGTMSTLGGKTIPDGAHVVVVRPGYSVEIGGRRIVITRPVVREAEPMESLPRSSKVGTPGTEAKATNPKHGSTQYSGAPVYPGAGKAGLRWTPDMGPLPSGAYEENCTNVVQAFELRMRGYDVQAAPLDILDRSGYASGRTFDETDQMLVDSWRSFPAERKLASQSWRSFAEIDAEIERWPEGGRGYIFVGKHIFNVVKVNGKAQYIEAQYDANASRIVTALYKSKYKTDPWISGPRAGIREEAKLVRVDDLEPTDAILRSVRTAE